MRQYAAVCMCMICLMAAVGFEGEEYSCGTSRAHFETTFGSMHERDMLKVAVGLEGKEYIMVTAGMVIIYKEDWRSAWMVLCVICLKLQWDTEVKNSAWSLQALKSFTKEDWP